MSTGLNTDLDAATLPPGQYSRFENVVTQGKGFRPRPADVEVDGEPDLGFLPELQRVGLLKSWCPYVHPRKVAGAGAGPNSAKMYVIVLKTFAELAAYEGVAISDCVTHGLPKAASPLSLDSKYHYYQKIGQERQNNTTYFKGEQVYVPGYPGIMFVAMVASGESSGTTGVAPPAHWHVGTTASPASSRDTVDGDITWRAFDDPYSGVPLLLRSQDAEFVENLQTYFYPLFAYRPVRSDCVIDTSGAGTALQVGESRTYAFRWSSLTDDLLSTDLSAVITVTNQEAGPRDVDILLGNTSDFYPDPEWSGQFPFNPRYGAIEMFALDATSATYRKVFERNSYDNNSDVYHDTMSSATLAGQSVFNGPVNDAGLPASLLNIPQAYRCDYMSFDNDPNLDPDENNTPVMVGEYTSPEAMVQHKGCLFLAMGRSAFFSEPYAPAWFVGGLHGTDCRLTFDDFVYAFVSRDEYLEVYTRNGAYMVVGNAPYFEIREFQTKIAPRTGKHIVATDIGTFVLSRDGLHLVAGGAVKNLSAGCTNAWLNDRDILSGVGGFASVSRVFASSDAVFIAYGLNAQTANNLKMLCYDFRRDEFFEYHRQFHARPQDFIQSSDGQRLMYFASYAEDQDDQVWRALMFDPDTADVVRIWRVDAPIAAQESRRATKLPDVITVDVERSGSEIMAEIICDGLSVQKYRLTNGVNRLKLPRIRARRAFLSLTGQGSFNDTMVRSVALG